MPERLTLTLTPAQRTELEQAVRHHEKPYIRERAAAMLKIAGGKSPHWVAEHGLLLKRDSDSVYGWLERYKVEGLKGLFIREGRGRKPSFSP